jgi:hypothetical protein
MLDTPDGHADESRTGSTRLEGVALAPREKADAWMDSASGIRKTQADARALGRSQQEQPSPGPVIDTG